MEEIDVAETLKTLSARMDELSNALTEKKLSNVVSEKTGKAMEKIRGQPFAYMGGAFVGGLALGYLMSKKGKPR